ncbi:MAG: putative sugar nucleotidyl transferase [Planctomycetota bacterium]|nr:putative sugar nucleotidyl transferase [Planctomycetota bacterium]
MQVIVFEDAGYRNLLPLVYSRATFNLRCGFDNLLSKIERAQGCRASGLFVRETLAAAIADRQDRPVNSAPKEDSQLWINGRLLLRKRIDLKPNTAAWRGNTLLAASLDAKHAAGLTIDTLTDPAALQRALADCESADLDTGTAELIDYPWQLVHANEPEIARQFGTHENKGDRDAVHSGAFLLNDSAIFVGPGTTIKPTAVLDAENGPIYIGEDATIGPHVSITGPCYVGDGCTIRPGASISASSIGPVCKVGGELEGSIIHGYSNKQHDGFLGHSYVGEWVNVGADTVNSDLKNTYGPVRVPINGTSVDSGETFVGAFVGDHTKTGINVALPTGCVIGHACNLFATRQPPTFVPSFSWLSEDGIMANDPAKALAVAKKVAARRNRTLSAAEEALFISIAETALQIERSP